MARIMTSCKFCRREGASLCGREKCAFKRRPSPPGVQAKTKKRTHLSIYGQQLREKQKAKRLYRVMERQFRRYFEKALKKKGNTSEFMVQFLELRLDNVVYRLRFSTTRAQARQLVNHGFILVNGKPVNIPSYQVEVGDEISFQPLKQNKVPVKSLSERLKNAQQEIPKWLHLETKEAKGKVVTFPEGDDLKNPFDPTLIVELYSR
ncbi:30S ribosomal protein S4 [Candidatus Uhrbacteria bacterium CG_4_9_14_3_um_filter_36_7]|uniref:Small ribosomal subunit protein uS4 n=1 Tax=Candidatus Uhrbacteria bacterium CG_4_9_14_3_um_filter_36_7 TaxID=1975033 RepID=A0A2M7XI90_9BACT|nr:MAG: 30S ribosomal protein S4 [Candidatus Uhrbacteria bacterium CG_4_9_14_3_um_filter_36_7]